MWAPYKVYLIVQTESREAREKAEELYKEMQDRKIEVLYDDREESLGVKFQDADLIGCPKRVLVSEKSLKKGGVEVKDRKEKEGRVLSFSELWAIL